MYFILLNILYCILRVNNADLGIDSVAKSNSILYSFPSILYDMWFRKMNCSKDKLVNLHISCKSTKLKKWITWYCRCLSKSRSKYDNIILCSKITTTKYKIGTHINIYIFIDITVCFISNIHTPLSLSKMLDV